MALRDDDDQSKTITRIQDLITQAEHMMQQVNQLYGQYLSGFEKIAPNVRRKQLDQLMDNLNYIGKPTQAIQFRYRTLFATYHSFRERWDRIVRKVEAGKKK